MRARQDSSLMKLASAVSQGRKRRFLNDSTGAIVAALVLSVAPSVVLGQGQTLNLTLTNSGYSRSYILYVPSTYAPGGEIPLVFNLHGGGRTAAEQMAWTGMNAVAEREGFLTAYPQAIGGEWWGPGGTNAYDDAGFFDAMIHDLSASYSVDASRTYVTGLSHGALMTYILTVARPYTFAAAAPVAAERPYAPGKSLYAPLDLPATPSRPFPLLHIHGTADQAIIYTGGYYANWLFPPVEQVVEEYAQSNGADVVPSLVDLPDVDATDSSTVQLLTYGNPDAYVDVEGNVRQAETLLYRVVNGGHNWPDTDVVRNPPVNRDINASELIWEFFTRHVLARPAGDFVEDGDVGEADLARWQSNFGLTSGATHAQGDANFDNAVDGADLLVWQRQLGLSMPLSSVDSPIPEPASAMLAACLLLLAVRSRRGASRSDAILRPKLSVPRPATVRRVAVLCFAIALAVTASPTSFATTWTSLDFPGAARTTPYDVDGGLIVGSYEDATGSHGFVYDGFTWTNLDYPGASATTLRAIDDGKMAGTYESGGSEVLHGFLYDGARWTALDYPESELTEPRDIDGGRIVGSYRDALGGYHGFLYDGSSWMTLDQPRVANTELNGIDGNKIVGPGFLYDGESWTALSFPSFPSGIDGRRIIGVQFWAIDSIEGGFYDGVAWTALNYPGWDGHGYAFPQGIDGDRIVGVYYRDSTSQGFLATLPEPNAARVLVLDGVVIVMVQRFRRDRDGRFEQRTGAARLTSPS